MRNKMLLLSDIVGDESSSISASGNGIVYLEANDAESVITSLTIKGQIDNALNSSDTGAGYMDSGECVLNIRIHGDCVLDGEEFVRILRETNAPVYGGEGADGCFIYSASATEESTVIDTDHLMLGSGVHAMKMTALVTDQIADGEALIPGLHFRYNRTKTSAISKDPGNIGECELMGTKPSAATYNGIFHIPMGSAMELPIITDSVRLYVGNTVLDEGYNGITVRQRIGKPLMAIPEAEVSDEIECVSGVITRRIGCMSITEDTVITSGSYEGFSCYFISLDRASDGSGVRLGSFSLVESTEQFYDDFYSMVLDPTGKTLILNGSDEGYTIDDLKAELMGSRIIYTLKEPVIEEVEPGIKGEELSVGRHIIEICSNTYPIVTVEYENKE